MKNETLHIRLKANMQKSLTNFKTWLVLSVFVLLGAIVPQEAKANYDSRGLWYFDNTNTNWTNVYLIVGRGDWTQAVKMVLQYDNIYKAESTWDNTYAFFFADSACGYSTGSGSAKDIVGSRTGNYTGNFTSKPSNNIFSPSGNGTNITGTWSTAYHLKHPWGTGNNNDWSWKVLKYNDGVYTLNALYASGEGCNYSKPNSTDEAGYVSNPTLVGSPTTGDECIFTFNPSNNAITITKVVTCNDITDVSSNFSLSETEYDYNGSSKKPTVSSTLDGIGDITTKYYNSEGNVVSEPTNAGTYTVKITVSQGATYCALTTETEVGTYTINKINQSDISIANNETTFCGFPANNQVTLNIDGGDGDGNVVYTSSDENKATISDNILTVKAEGTVTISAQKQAGTNHNASNTATKSFTFYKAPDAPTEESVTNLIKCGDNTTDGVITLKNYNSNSNYTYSIVPNDGVSGNAEEGYIISKERNYTITVTRKVNETCSISTPSASISVGLTDKTPAATVSITGKNSICNGQSTTLTCNVSTTKGNVQSYQWNLNDTPIQGATESTYNASETGNYTVVVTVSNDGCTEEFTNSTPFSLTVNPLPAAPSLTSPAPVCEGTTVNLPTGFNWYDAEKGGNKVADTAIEATGTYWAAALQNECESATRTRYDVRVNPKPTIDIGENVTAVKFEDVELTATGENIANVEWTVNKGTITEDATDPKKAILTYDQTGEVTVTATATSAAGCTSVAATKIVTFGEEDCTQTEDEKTIEIWCRMSDNSNGSSIKCYGFGAGNFFGSYPGSTANNGTGTYESKTYQKWIYTFDSKKSGLKVIFNTQGDTDKTGDISVGSSGKRYYYWYNKSSKTYGLDDSETIYTPKPITAPAVKTVSATSEEGSGIVTFTGKLLKTGCATGSAIWVGYQYKKADEEWPTTDVTAGSGKKQLATISNNPGSEDFTAEVNVENLEDGDYHFRAYVINGYGRSADPNNYDQGVYYGLDKLVTVRNTKTAIISVALQHADEYGNPILSTPTYCAGTTAYLLLTYVGSRPDVVNWSSTLSNTITKVDGNLYKFTVAGSETITVSAKNEENIDFVQGTIDVAAYSIPLTPMVELDKSEICSNDEDGATITVTNAQDGIQYYLYKTGDDEAVQGPITGIGSLAFTGIKTAATYYVSAVNSNCLKYKVESQKRAITVIDASQNTIAIEPTTKTINPWGTVTLNVTKNSQYDYTLKCMQEDTDVTANLVINKKGDTYSIKFPKPSTADIVDGQVTFSDIIYIVTVTLDGSVQCGTTSATSTVTLTKLIEDCD